MKPLFRFVILCTFFLTVTDAIFSQNTGTVSGSVTDAITDEPIEEAGISLYSVNDSVNVVTGANTDAAGNFVIGSIPHGEYNAKINMIGYETAFLKGINITTSIPDINLGMIRLKPGETVTDEILVEGEISDVQFSAEKKIFNVGKDLTIKGGSSLDALRNVPSVNVDQDGNVSLRGSERVKLTIDGKPFGLDGPNRTNILRSISADNIESIEVITNPSARYEAEGVSGIINIVTKRNDGFGYNGTTTLSMGTRDKYNGSFSGNLKNDDLNIFLDYNKNIWTSNFNSESSRQVFFNNSFPFYELTADSRFRTNSDYIRGGVDYTINKFNSFTLSGSYNLRNSTNNGDQDNREFDSGKNLANRFLTGINSNNDGYNLDFAFNYYMKFEKPKQSLTGEITYSGYGDDRNSNTIISDVFSQNAREPLNYNELQNDVTKEINTKWDYVHPIGENSKFEAGYSGEFVIDKRFYSYDTLDYNLNQYIQVANRSNEFSFNRQINGAYAIISSGLGKNFTYQFGLRAEYTSRQGDLVTTGQNFNKYYFDMFPSVSMSQKLGTEEEFQFSYSRRINRPRASMLNPFPSFTAGNRNIFTGNPNLQPEYINSFELSFIKFFSGSSVSPSLFYRRSDNNISRTRTFLDSITTVTKFDNFNTSDTYGAELIVSSKPTSWLTLNGSISYFKAKINADNLEQGLSNENSTMSGRISSTVRIPDLFNLQFSYYYSGEILSAQAIIEPFQSFDAAVSKDFLDGSATVSFRVSDIFNATKFDINIKDSKYSETLLFKRDSRVANLSFTYRFGEQDKNQRRKPQAPSSDGGSIGF